MVPVVHDLAMKRTGDVEQQQRVTGWGGVDDDVLGAAEAEEAAEGAEHGDLGRARRTQILGDQVACSAVAWRSCSAA